MLQASKEQALLAKNFAFSFVNYYGTVLFAAYWKRDLPRARSLILNFLLTKQIVSKVWRYAFGRYRTAINRLQQKISKKVLKFFFPPEEAEKNSNQEAVGRIAQPEATGGNNEMNGKQNSDPSVQANEANIAITESEA